MAKTKAVSDKTDSAFNRVKSYFRNIVAELKKVHWPNRRQLLVYTGVVFFAVIFSSMVIWLFDIGISWVLELITNAVS
jgi:preprotein translocase subunit SecE